MFGSYFERFYVIIFWGKDQPQSEGSRHTDHGVKLLPDESSCVCVSSVSLSVQRRSCFVARRTLAVYNAVTVIEVRRAADRDPGSCVLRYMHRQDRDERRTCRLKNLYGVL